MGGQRTGDSLRPLSEWQRQFHQYGDADSQSAQRVPVASRRFSQTRWVIVAMILGVAVGYFFPDSKAAGFHASDLPVLSTIFLRMVKMLVASLILPLLAVGFVGHGVDLWPLERLGWG